MKYVAHSVLLYLMLVNITKSANLETLVLCITLDMVGELEILLGKIRRDTTPLYVQLTMIERGRLWIRSYMNI